MTTSTNNPAPKDAGNLKTSEESSQASNSELFIGLLPSPPQALSIEEMNEVIRAAWADEKKGLQ